MTPREWCLLLDGRMEAEKDKARWLAPLVSASASQMLTPAQVAIAAGKRDVAAQLLLEEENGETESEAARIKRAERQREALMRKIARRRKRERERRERENQCQA